LRADIVSNVITGIRVPKEALHLDDDLNTFIYLQTSGFAERVDVEVLRETGDSVLVRDGVASGTPLRVDSIIIVRANDLYHGKVVG
jgi:multidrug efflux pump subunit AcrA (membrane-fusion protein)